MEEQTKIKCGRDRGRWAYSFYNLFIERKESFKELPESEQKAWIATANLIISMDRKNWNDVPTLELQEHTIVRDKEPHIVIRYLK